MKTIKFYLVLLFTACTLLVNAQTPEGYPANYARGPATLPNPRKFSSLHPSAYMKKLF